jgi:hypothetical protein
MRLTTLPLFILALSAGGTAGAACLDAVEIGEPGYMVIEKCGEPQRREREEYIPTKKVEVIRGTSRIEERPVPPIVIEKWYYDTSLNAATVIHLQDNGVTRKERLIRGE